jgi:diguanylate cyclase (GGDEF)-like protein
LFFGGTLLSNHATVPEPVAFSSQPRRCLGGEEFDLLLPETTLADAAQMVERIRAAIGGRGFEANDLPHHLTVSAGLCVAAHGEELEHVLRRADQALYEPKHGGRDRLAIRAKA